MSEGGEVDRLSQLESVLGRSRDASRRVTSTLSTFVRRFTVLTQEMKSMNQDIQDCHIAHRNIVETLNVLSEVESHIDSASALESDLTVELVSSDLDGFLDRFDDIRRSIKFFHEHHEFKVSRDALDSLMKINGHCVRLLSSRFRFLARRACARFKDVDGLVRFLCKDRADPDEEDAGIPDWLLKRIGRGGIHTESESESVADDESDDESDIGKGFSLLRLVALSAKRLDVMKRPIFFNPAVVGDLSRISYRLFRVRQRDHETMKQFRRAMSKYVSTRQGANERLLKRMYGRPGDIPMPPTPAMAPTPASLGLLDEDVVRDEGFAGIGMSLVGVGAVMPGLSSELQSSYSKGSHEFIPLMKVVLRLVQEESAFVERIVVAERSQRLTLQRIVAPAIQFMCSEGEMIAEGRTSVPMSDDFRCFLLLDLIERYQERLKEEFELVLQNQFENGLANIGEMFRVFAANVLTHFREIHKGLITGGMREWETPVNSATSKAFSFFRRLLDYLVTVERVLEGYVFDSAIPAEGHASILGRFIEEVVELTIYEGVIVPIARTRRKTKHESLLYLLNNYHHILVKLERPEIRPLVAAELIEAYAARVHEAQETFLNECWKKMLESLDRDVDIQVTKNKKLIRRVFRNFHRDFDRLTKKSSLAISNKNLRQEMVEKTKHKVGPPYRDFFAKYEDFLMSDRKFLGKDPKSVENLIAGMYLYEQ